MAWRRGQDAARLPAPPDDSGYSQAVRDHVGAAFAAAQENPRSSAAVGPLCVAYHADVLFERADACYAVASDLDPDEWLWVYRRALIHAERGGGQPLIAALRDVVTRQPGFGPAWLRLGDAEFKAGRHAEAAAAWRRARELPEPERPSGEPLHVVEAPAAAYAALGLARVALVQGDPSGARDLLEGVVRDTPGFGPALRLLAESYRALGRVADAERAVYRANRQPPYTPYAEPFVDALARESRNSILLLRLASEANLAVNGAWSEFLTRRAAEFDPGNPEVIVKLGRVLRTLGRNDEALQWFQKYTALVPQDFQGLAHIGSCLSAMGRYAEAEPYLRRAVAGLDDPLTHYNLGLLMAVTGRLDDAVSEYERALARDPMFSDARSNLAAALVRQGQVARAARELRRVIEHDPDNAQARTNLGLTLIQQGATREATVHLEEALRLDPRLTPAADALASIGGRSDR